MTDDDKLFALNPKLLAGDRRWRRQPCRAEVVSRLVDELELAITQFFAGKWDGPSWLKLLVHFERSAGRIKPAELDHRNAFRRVAAWRLHHHREAVLQRCQAIQMTFDSMAGVAAGLYPSREMPSVSDYDQLTIRKEWLNRHIAQARGTRLELDYPFHWNPW